MVLAVSSPSIRWRAPIALAAAASGTVAAAASRNPFHPGAWPACPFHAITGWYCPFCGSTRALYALAHGRWALVAANNALLPALAVLAVWGWLHWTSGGRRWAVPSPVGSVWVRVAVPAVIFAFWVARNLPGLSVLAPHGHP